MSIASEIERLQTAKTSIKTAIKNKGVEVGDVTIDKYASKIDEISTEDEIVERTISGSYTNNRITKVGENAFRGSQLQEFNSTSVTFIGRYAFYYVSTLEECNTPNANSISDVSIFSNCTSLKKLSFPLNTGGIGSNAFQNCTALSYLNLGGVVWISANSFNGCSNLEILIITRSSYVASLSNINAFTGSAIANGTGFIYVPDNLYESYLTATNWSTYASQIKKISELPEGIEV